MKNLKTVLAVVALTFSSAIFASSTSEDLKTESATITQQVQKLLSNPNFLVEKEIVAKVKITLNSNNEMVVLSVDSESNYIGEFIKSRLNYNELPTTLESSEKTFIVPVRVTPEK
jgi:hypothetical protein